VRMKGLEPPRLAAPDPKSGAATNYATSAGPPKKGCKSKLKYFQNKLFIIFFKNRWLRHSKLAFVRLPLAEALEASLPPNCHFYTVSSSNCLFLTIPLSKFYAEKKPIVLIYSCFAGK